jgi:hypothetical protein
MITIIYIVIAILFLIAIHVAMARARSVEPRECATEKEFAPRLGQANWLDLSERIFDPSDVRWLREDLAFPRLANSLADARKQLAIRWLRALKASFDALVRIPDSGLGETPGTPSVGSWQMLWLTVRFQFLLSYALLVVRYFGPYHRLIPSFNWVPFPPEAASRIESPVYVDNRNVS